MFPPDTSFDEAARYILRQGSPELLFYLSGLSAEQVGFVRWFDSVVMVPGTKERICDAIAQLTDHQSGGKPVACLVEFQTEPDPDMANRLLVAGGLFSATNKPTPHPGDRYDLAFLVVNLTGAGNASREMKLGDMQLRLIPREWNLQILDAGAELDLVEQGKAPQHWLAFIPLMQKGDQPDIISRWREIADKEMKMSNRQTLSLAVIFAGAKGRHDIWRKGLEGYTLIESPIVREWKDEAERKATRSSLIRLLKLRFGTLPADMIASIEVCEDKATLEGWLDQVVLVLSLQEFREKAKI